MELDEAFVRRVEHPQQDTLKELLAQSCTTTESRLRQWGVGKVDEKTIRKLSYAYFHDWTTDDPDFMFLLQDPGGVKKRHTNHIHKFSANGSILDQISVYRYLAKTWLAESHADFSQRFFSLFDELGLIDINDSWKQYLLGEMFFDDFYMTDVVKYRCDGFTKTEERASVDALLQHEFDEIDPEIVFTFGGKAWSAIREQENLRPFNDSSMDESKIQEVHGQLFTMNHDTYVLPLCHMSGQIWWRFPPEEYLERLQTGLEHWIDVR